MTQRNISLLRLLFRHIFGESHKPKHAKVKDDFHPSNSAERSVSTNIRNYNETSIKAVDHRFPHYSGSSSSIPQPPTFPRPAQVDWNYPQPPSFDSFKPTQMDLVSNNHSSNTTDQLVSKRINRHDSTHQLATQALVSGEVKRAIACSKIVALDTETTGFSHHDRITDIGLVIINDSGKQMTYEHLINPGIKIPEAIEEKTGITNSMVNAQPSAQDIFSEIIPVLQNKTLLGHNISFDLNMINTELLHLGLKSLRPLKIIDTKDEAQELLNLPNYKLDTLCAALGVNPGHHHHALDDALATLRCHKILRSKQLLDSLDNNSLSVAHIVSQQKTEQKAFLHTFMRDNYQQAHNSKPQNKQPENLPTIAAEGGVGMIGVSTNQQILENYGKGTYFWVVLEKAYIAKGKYQGYPTVKVFLDGEMIGYIGHSYMAKHIKQLKENRIAALAHVCDRHDDRKLKVRVEFPKEHAPIDLTPYCKSIEEESRSIRPSDSGKCDKQSVQKEIVPAHPHHIQLMTPQAANQAPHRKMLYGSISHTYTLTNIDPCQPYKDGSIVYLRVHRLSATDNVYSFFLDKHHVLNASLDLADYIEPGRSRTIKAVIHRKSSQVALEILLPD